MVTSAPSESTGILKKHYTLIEYNIPLKENKLAKERKFCIGHTLTLLSRHI